MEILSGVFEGMTTGTPISLMVRNQDQRSRDYSNIAEIFRPGHADFGYWEKYGIRDYRGGGRSSGRETIGRVAAGAVAAKVLGELGITFTTFTRSIGPVEAASVDVEQIFENALYMPDSEAAAEAAAYLEACMKNRDSAGGVIECWIDGVPAGIGEPVFDKLDARLAQAVFSIGAVKGFEIGDGFAAAKSNGSRNNDPLSCETAGWPRRPTTRAEFWRYQRWQPDYLPGGCQADRLHQSAPAYGGYPRTGAGRSRSADGMIRVIVPRAVVVVESMAAITILDGMLSDLGCRMEDLRRKYTGC